MSFRFLFIWLLLPVAGFSQTFKMQLPLFFESNSFTPGVTETEKLKQFFNSGISVEAIAVEGFCDDIGTENDNLILSRNRAETVAEYIRENFGYTVNAVSGKGEITTISNDTVSVETSRAKNRRATVYIDYSVTEKPETASGSKQEKDLYAGYKTVNDDLEIGDKIILRHLLFQGSRTVFEDAEEAEAELQTLTDYFKKNPGITFEVNGHVCCITNSFWDARDIDTGKNNLSEARAKKIYDYFIEKGIARERMVYKGYGRKFPRPGILESLNKRVEIVIVKI